MLDQHLEAGFHAEQRLALQCSLVDAAVLLHDFQSLFPLLWQGGLPPCQLLQQHLPGRVTAGLMGSSSMRHPIDKMPYRVLMASAHWPRLESICEDIDQDEVRCGLCSPAVLFSHLHNRLPVVTSPRAEEKCQQTYQRCHGHLCRQETRLQQHRKQALHQYLRLASPAQAAAAQLRFPARWSRLQYRFNSETHTQVSK